MPGIICSSENVKCAQRTWDGKVLTRKLVNSAIISYGSTMIISYIKDIPSMRMMNTKYTMNKN